MTVPIVEARGVSRAFAMPAGPVAALRDVSLSISPADYVGVVGPWGCGKSPLRHVRGGVDTPTSGGVVFTADLGGVLYALDAADGRTLWQFDSGQSAGGGVISYYAGGRQLVGIASGMKSSVWPGAAQQSRILVFGLR